MINSAAGLEIRILVLAPSGRDASLLAATLAGDGMSPVICPDANALVQLLGEGAAAVIAAEEALTAEGVDHIAGCLALQPPWSDIPFVVLTFSGRANATTVQRVRALEVLGNITFLERPARPDTVRSSMRAALRARLRQYEMRHRQEILIRVNADLERFAYSASHDLQEPIRNIAIYGEILAIRYADSLDEMGLEMLGNVRAAAIRMQTLVHDILAYTQAATIAEEVTEPCDSLAAFDAALSNLAESVPSDASITHGPLPEVRAGLVHLQQMLQNLIGNAIKYRRSVPLRVHVSARESGEFWLFSVEDNGIGIAGEYRQQVFGVFKRLHTQQAYPGTGIGLAICQRIAERYGGRIWVESELEKGSTFFFTIPV